MGLHSTSPNFAKAREPRDENLLQGNEREGHQGGRSPRATGDSAIGPQDRGSPQKVVAADLALDWVLQEIVRHARLATSATGAFIGLVRANKIVCQAMSGSNAGEFVAYLNRDRRMVDSCLRTNAPQRCHDSEASEELEGSACRYLGARSVVIVPILDEREAKLGIFGVLSPQVDAFSNANLVALQSLSRRVTDAMSQVDLGMSVSVSDAAHPLPPTPGKVLPIRARLLRAVQRPIAITGRGSSRWILGVLAVVLIGGWTLSRVMNQDAMQASAKAPATVSQAASVGSAVGDPMPASPSTASPLSNNAGTNHGQSPVVPDAVKPAKSPQPAHKAKDIKKIPARSEPPVPDLEIENALDDASPGSLPSKSVNASKASDETSPVPVPRPGAADARPVPANASSTPASPVVIPEKAALDLVAQRVEPHYPVVPNAEPVQGTAIVDVVVGIDGQVKVVKPVSGDLSLLKSAVKAVRKWRFTPLVRDGQAVSFESHITFHFASP
jgi:TonB family protein